MILRAKETKGEKPRWAAGSPIYSVTMSGMTAGEMATVISAMENYAKGSPIAHDIISMLRDELKKTATGYVRERLAKE